MAGDALAADDVSGWARRIAGVLRRSGRPLLVLQAAVLLPAGGIAYGLSTLGLVGGIAAGLVAAGALALAQAASVDLTVREAAGRPTPVSAALARGVRRTPELLGWSALTALLTVAGLALAVLPGLYVAVVGAAALPGAVVVERAGLRRAAGLVNSRLAGTLVRCAFGLFAAAFYGALAGALVQALPTGGPSEVVRALVVLPFSVLATAFGTVTYAGLRWSGDGATSADLAADLDL